MYWGKYVAHDNNRDGMGQFLALTKQRRPRRSSTGSRRCCTTCTRQSTYLYASTGTGPYNEQIDPITIDEWWLLAKNEVMEMTKRGVPGVWTYGFYDGWVPNYMFFIAHSHNAIGRFYEVQSYGPENRTVTAGADHDQPRVVPSEPAAADDPVGPAQQHQHPAVGAPDRAQPRREEQGHVSRELLAQEQARRRQGQDRSDLRLGDPGRRSGARPTPPRRSTSCAGRASRSTPPTAAFKAGNVEVKAGRLHHPRRSAVSHASPTCTSRCRTTRRPTRVRTTTPAGRSSTCATSSIKPIDRQGACSTSAMTLVTADVEGAGRHRRHRAGA